MRRALLFLPICAVLAALPALMTSGYAIALLCQIGVAALFALSYNMLMGETGMLSFGHAVYYGTGAFVVIHLMRAVNDQQIAVPIALLPFAGGVMAMVLGVLLGAVITRRSGIAFAMITLGLGEVATAVAHMFQRPFGGEAGITADRTLGPTLAGLNFGPQRELYWLVLAWVCLSALVIYGLTRTPVGRIANAVRDNAERVSYLGYDPRVIRLIMYCAAAFFAGVAGGLAAITFEMVTVEALSLAQSSNVVLMSFIGGSGHFVGPILGAALVTWLQSSLSGYSDAWLFYYGLFFVMMTAFAPQGLAGLAAQFVVGIRGAAPGAFLARLARGAASLAPLVAGTIVLVELGYRLSSVSTRGRELTLAGRSFDAGSWLLWVLGVLTIMLGLLLARRLGKAETAAAGEAGVTGEAS